MGFVDAIASAVFLRLVFFSFPVKRSYPSWLNRPQSIGIHSIAQAAFKTGISIDSPDRSHSLQTLAGSSPLPEEVP